MSKLVLDENEVALLRKVVSALLNMMHNEVVFDDPEANCYSSNSFSDKDNHDVRAKHIVQAAKILKMEDDHTMQLRRAVQTERLRVAARRK